MAICTNYRDTGFCRFGTRCRFEHVEPQRGGRPGFGAAAGSRNNAAGKAPPYSESSIKADLTTERPLWKLSSYTAGKDLPNLIEGLDVCPEELRLRAYEANQTQNINNYLSSTTQLENAAQARVQDVLRDLRGAVQYMDRLAKGEKPAVPFGGQATTSSAFGSMPPTSAFGSNKPASAFSNTSGTSAFGQSSTSGSAFGTGSAFGKPSQPTSVFAQTSTPSAFGGQSQTTSAFGGTNLQPAAGKSAFGRYNSSSAAPSAFDNASTPSAFGQTSTPSAFGTPSSTSAFGQTSTPSAFGQTAAPSAFGGASTFGSTSTSNTGSAFGQTSKPVSAFGQPPAPTSAFGQISAPSAFGTPSAFGQTSASTSAFGQTSQPASAFGQPSAFASAASTAAPANPFSQSCSNPFAHSSQGPSSAAPTPFVNLGPAASSSAFGAAANGAASNIYLLKQGAPDPPQESDLPEELIKRFQAQVFVIGMVPEIEPPLSLR